jgi:hypothetical protein
MEPFSSNTIPAREPILVTMHTYEGRDLLDIRHYSRIETGELVHTFSGVSMPAKDTSEILRTVRAVVEIDASKVAKVVRIQVKTTTYNPVVVSVNVYKGVKSLDIRHHYTKKGSSELLPTKKGVSIPWAEVETILSALTAATLQVPAPTPTPEPENQRTTEEILVSLGIEIGGRFSQVVIE